LGAFGESDVKDQKKNPSITFPSFEDTGITPSEMEEARARARRKLADDYAMAEIGLVDAKVPARKGPIPVPEEEMFTLTIQMEPTGAMGDRLIIDGKAFLHGQTVTVSKRVYDSICEMISRGYGHQREIEGKDNNFYRKEQNINAITGRPTSVG
jgi:hypothetical protein